MTVAQRRRRSLKWSRSHHYTVSFANPASGTSSSASHSGTRVSTHCHRFDKEPSLSPLRPSSRCCHPSRGKTHTHLFLFPLSSQESFIKCCYCTYGPSFCQVLSYPARAQAVPSLGGERMWKMELFSKWAFVFQSSSDCSQLVQALLSSH